MRSKRGMVVTTPIKAFSLEVAPQFAAGFFTSFIAFDALEYTCEESLGLCPSRSPSEFLILVYEFRYLHLFNCIIFNIVRRSTL
jgi:hypothetical protein